MSEERLRQRIRELIVENARFRKIANDAFDVANERRHELIHKEFSVGLSDADAAEYRRMQEVCRLLIQPYEWGSMDNLRGMQRKLSEASKILDDLEAQS